MNIVDSSGWIEYFADEENADFFAEPIQQINQLIVSAINIYEVFKHVLREEDRSKAHQAIAYMRQARFIELDIALAIEAAETSHQLKIPGAATGRRPGRESRGGRGAFH